MAKFSTIAAISSGQLGLVETCIEVSDHVLRLTSLELKFQEVKNEKT